jgi:hypothetical protein
MDTRNLIKLARILGLLGSEHPGERASAAYAADRMVAAMGTSWAELLLSNRATASRRTPSYGVDEKGAAEARMRQLRDRNERLERQVRSLRRRLAAKADAERKRRFATDSEEEPE